VNLKLEPHQQRMVEEQKQLAERIQGLVRFVNGPQWGQIARVERDRMRDQLAAMEAYHAALLARIEAWGT
jgi:hypothetical protein